MTSALPTTEAWARLMRLRRGLRLYVPSVWLLLLVAVLSLGIGFAEAGLLYVIVRTATSLAAGGEPMQFSIGSMSVELEIAQALTFAAGLLAALLLGTLALAAASASLITRTVRRARVSIATAFVDASWSGQAKEAEGRLQTVLTGHVQRLGPLMLQFTSGVSAGLNLVAYLLTAFLLDPLAAALVLGGVVIAALLLVPLNIRAKAVSRRNRDLGNHYATEVSQVVRVAREVHVFGVRDAVKLRLGHLAHKAERLQWQSRLLAKLTPGLYRALALALVVVGLALVRDVEAERLGDLGALVLLLVRALSYGQQLSTTAQQLAESKPFVEELSAVGARYTMTAVRSGTRPMTQLSTVVLQDVQYRYASRSEPVLHDVTLSMDRGDVLGIVGPSGSGKSTLVQVLLRLRLPTAGSYEVNGTQVEELLLEDWYRRVSFVPQDNHLVRGSIRDNIRFYRDDVSDDAVESAAVLAHLHEEILALPNGYDTLVGGGDRDLSGGQRQRLGLARGLAGRPELLVLDEPTSALDMRSEELVRQTLEALQGSLTMVVVAHRLSTLRLCDRIVVLEGGRVVAQGTHEQLRSSNPFYREAVLLSDLGSRVD